MRISLLLTLLAQLTAAYSPKRGYVADDCKGPLCNGNTLLGAAWYYGYNPADPYTAPADISTFVPMHWCMTGQDAPLPAGTNATYVLGYNEPNLAGQCGLAPAAAAAAWGVYLKRWPTSALVSPATAGNGVPWLDAFLGNCTSLYGARGCQLSYIAVHDYTCQPAELLAYLQSIHDRYSLPVWLTEFSCGDGRQNKPQAEHLAYMKAVFPLLDAAPFVHRYGACAAARLPREAHALYNPPIPPLLTTTHTHTTQWPCSLDVGQIRQPRAAHGRPRGADAHARGRAVQEPVSAAGGGGGKKIKKPPPLVCVCVFYTKQRKGGPDHAQHCSHTKRVLRMRGGSPMGRSFFPVFTLEMLRCECVCVCGGGAR